MRHAVRQRRMGMPLRWKTSELLGSRRANAATNRESAANQPFSGCSSVVSWLRRRTPALHARRGAVRGHVPAGRRHGRVRSCPTPSRPTPPRARLRGGARARGAPAPAAPDTTRDTANNRPFHGPRLAPVALAMCPSLRFLRTRGLVPSCAAWSAASGTRPRHAARWAWAVGLRC